MTRRHRLRAAIIAAATATAVACTAAPAQAAGSVAHHCNVPAKVDVFKKTRGGYFLSRLPCGTGTSNVHMLTVRDRPYYIKLPNRSRMLCRQAGEFFYPYNSGGSATAVIYPTVRCS